MRDRNNGRASSTTAGTVVAERCGQIHATKRAVARGRRDFIGNCCMPSSNRLKLLLLYAIFKFMFQSQKGTIFKYHCTKYADGSSLRKRYVVK